MAEQESAAVRNVNRQSRKEQQAEEGAVAWKEYLERKTPPVGKRLDYARSAWPEMPQPESSADNLRVI